jgi:hypothetical protein
MDRALETLYEGFLAWRSMNEWSLLRNLIGLGLEILAHHRNLNLIEYQIRHLQVMSRRKVDQN